MPPPPMDSMGPMGGPGDSRSSRFDQPPPFRQPPGFSLPRGSGPPGAGPPGSGGLFNQPPPDMPPMMDRPPLSSQMDGVVHDDRMADPSGPSEHPPEPPVSSSSSISQPPVMPDKKTSSAAASSALPRRPARIEIGEDGDLPSALEKVLSYKGERAQEVGVSASEAGVADVDQKAAKKDASSSNEKDDPASSGYASADTEASGTAPQQIVDVAEADEDDDEDDEMATESKKSQKPKSRTRKRKKKGTRTPKFEKQLEEERAKQLRNLQERQRLRDEARGVIAPVVQIEYITDGPDMDETDPSMRYFRSVFDRFKLTEPDDDDTKKTEDVVKPDEDTIKEEKQTPEELAAEAEKAEQEAIQQQLSRKALAGEHMTGEEGEEVTKEVAKLSKKRLKLANRLSVAELKQLVSRPDVVEWHDVTAADPKLLVYLKSTRNTVPVPRHWCFKRKYLQGKRGIEKPPFQLPDFIRNTGIMEMRSALQEKEEKSTLKQKLREKVRPKLGKIDIDYQKLHDAFFKYQTKPPMTSHGELYYEGKEYELQLREKKPGNISDDLRIALGMPVGANADKFPPPWLIAMQRYGPPPSYPELKIAGLNAPIPDNCTFGYHAGGWGKPPVDEIGRPLYGDVFGQKPDAQPIPDEDLDQTLWGELESESESEEDESDEDVAPDDDRTGLATPMEGLATPSGTTSVPAGMETPGEIELRKKRVEDAMDGGETPASNITGTPGQLYTILPEKRAAAGQGLMGSAHVYDMTAAQTESSGKEGVEISLQPDELELDAAAIQSKYEERTRAQAGDRSLQKEDLSYMVAEHAAKQRKRKKPQVDTGSGSKSQAKKYKEFKF